MVYYSSSYRQTFYSNLLSLLNLTEILRTQQAGFFLFNSIFFYGPNFLISTETVHPHLWVIRLFAHNFFSFKPNLTFTQ